MVEEDRNLESASSELLVMALHVPTGREETSASTYTFNG